jgi:DNA-binding transcriptional LysR family regulator
MKVVKTGGIGKAAKELGLSQPVASKAIADLEYSLKVRLLDRNAKGTVPTRYADELVRCGTAVFDDLRTGIKAIEALADPAAGELRIGCTEPLAAGFTATVIDQLSQKFPRAVFHVTTADPHSLIEQKLQQRQVELIVAPTEGVMSDRALHIEILFDDRQVVIAGSNSRWPRKRKLALQDLKNARWFLPPPDSQVGAYIADKFRSEGLEPPQPHFASFSISLCQRMLERADVVAMVPISMAHFSQHKEFRILALKAVHVPRPTGIVTLRNRGLSPLAQLFIDHSRKLAEGL